MLLSALAAVFLWTRLPLLSAYYEGIAGIITGLGVFALAHRHDRAGGRG